VFSIPEEEPMAVEGQPGEHLTKAKEILGGLP
jgi:hypothetical protein